MVQGLLCVTLAPLALVLALQDRPLRAVAEYRIPVVVGCGLDLIDIARFEREVSRHGDGLLTEVFTDIERQRAAALPRPACGHAGAFAVKEACLKALGTGLIGRMSWRDITVMTDHLHPPRVTLVGETARVAAEQGVERIHAALAFTRDKAIAWIVLWRAHGV